MAKTSNSHTRIAVLGLGNWGTALANYLSCLGYSVTGWSIEASVVEGLNQSRRNPKYLSHQELSDSLTATTDISCVSDVDYVLCVVPSKALPEVVKSLPKPSKNPPVLISAIKGFVGSELFTPLQYFNSLGYPSERLAVISGPSFAIDVVSGKPCGVACASESLNVAKQLSEIFRGSMRLYPSEDPTGVELGGILKNVIAVAAGVSDGLKLGDSARAGLITRGLAEIVRLAEALGAKRETLFGLSGLGDLMMTCSCDSSRNRTVGIHLGQGKSLKDIVESLGSVAEGVRTAPLVAQLGEKVGIEMPITAEVNKLLQGEILPEQMADNLMRRPVALEFP